jgi:hypothetical protein
VEMPTAAMIALPTSTSTYSRKAWVLPYSHIRTPIKMSSRVPTQSYSVVTAVVHSLELFMRYSSYESSLVMP